MWAGKQPSIQFKGRRSPVLGRHGMVASSQPLASEAGLRILKAGGNAMDAAIAIAAALNVTEPTSTGMGGDCFMLYYEASTKKVYGLNGSGRCPSALTLERAKADCGVPGTDDMDKTHAHTVTVPGAVAGWCDSFDRFGSKKLSLADVLKPAIELAEEGFPVSPVAAFWWAHGEAKIKRPNNHESELLCPSTGHAPGVGEIFRNPTIAQTLRDIGTGGKDAFYTGRVAQAIVDVVTKNGGLLSMDDLAQHTSTWVDPISTTYGPVRVWEIPPNGQGLTALLALNLIKALDRLEGLPHNGPDYLHQLIEVLRLAFADTRWYIADPDVVSVPVAELLADSYAASRAASFDPNVATADVEKGQPTKGSCTVSFQVVDSEGNAVSFINSIYMDFGVGLVPLGCGFALQNRGANFSLNPQHPNALAPNKRPYHTIIPGLATYEDSGSLFATFSNMGGFMQPQGHVQLILNMLHFKMDPQAAIDVPRICITDGTGNGAVCLEEGIEDETLDELRRRGHNLLPEPREGYVHHAYFGKAQIIAMDPETGVLWAGSDGRGDGCAMGW